MSDAPRPLRLLLCRKDRGVMGASCVGAGAETVLPLLESALKERGLDGDVVLGRAACFGHCEIGPNLRIVAGPFIHHLSADTLDAALDQIAEAVSARKVPPAG